MLPHTGDKEAALPSGETLTVAMPNYNHAPFLPEAIEAVVKQSRPPDEFIILDDCSTDDSLSIIKQYAAKHPYIRLIQNPENVGVIKSLDLLCRAIRGRYVCFPAADDFLLPGYFEKAMNAARSNPDAGVIFGYFSVVDAGGKEICTIEPTRLKDTAFLSPREFLLDYLEAESAQMSLSGATVYRTDALRAVGCFRSELESWADTFAIRAIGLRHGAVYIAHKSLAWRRLPQSFSSSVEDRPERAFRYVREAARLMRSEEFRPYFPSDHVDRWERGYLAIARKWAVNRLAAYAKHGTQLADELRMDGGTSGPLAGWLLRQTIKVQSRLLDAIRKTTKSS